jgi:translation initiation factor 4A
MTEQTQDQQDDSFANSRTDPKDTVIEVIDNFDDMGLPIELLRGIYAYGFEKPSAIQQRAIVPFMRGRDVIAQAQSGTGKTGTFLIGALARLGQKSTGTRVIIVSPTRELAVQTHGVVVELSAKMKIKNTLCVGGTGVSQNSREISQGSDLVVGTPGRIYDLIRRKIIKTDSVQTLVIDEADEMLSQGFKDQIYDIFIELPKEVQVGLFSATLTPEVMELTTKFMNNPLKILVKTEELTLEGIRQFHIKLDQEEWKLDTLLDLWATLNLTQTIIYVNTKRKCQWLTHRLREQGHPVAEIHSDLPPADRTEIMRQFKSGGTRILITTDLLARGIDVQQVALVINYDLPQNVETYLHRIGRSGRFGRKGLAINFISPHDYSRLQDIMRFYRTDIPEMPNDIADYI